MAPRAIQFQDANFPHHSVLGKSKLDGIAPRWVPYGMPRLNPAYTSTVFFLMAKDGKTPVGSGVIVGEYMLPVGVTHRYAVTAHHATKSAYSLRINTKAGKSRPIPVDPDQWSALFGIEDIAALDISDLLRLDDDTAYISPPSFISREFIKTVELGVGEDGFMLGLFTGHGGKSKNMIAARFGNISLLANDNEPIFQKDSKITSPCHVFDIHSRPGFSGAPVFVYRTPTGDLRDIERKSRDERNRALQLEKAVLEARMPSDSRLNYLAATVGTQPDWMLDMDVQHNAFVRLLGVHVAQFHDGITLQKIKAKSAKTESDYDIKDGDNVRFPSSMTIVVPAWQIDLLLKKDIHLIEQRKAREARALKHLQEQDSVVVSEAATVAEVEPEADNPSHKEDFTSLLGAAAKARRAND